MVKARFKAIDDEVLKRKHVINQEYERKVEFRDKLTHEIQLKDDQITQLDQEEKSVKAKYEKMILDLKDRIKVLKMGQDKTTNELKQTRQELNQENKKFDRYLERDKERLVYAQNMLKTRRLVHLSYANEIKRRENKK